MGIRTLILDVDGVLTDGRLQYTSDGEEIKTFDVKDGLAMAAAVRAGLQVGIVTGRQSPVVRRRVEELKLTFLVEGCADKTAALRTLEADGVLRADESAYMGDDWNDLGIMKSVALPMAPADAVREVIEAAEFVSPSNGGHGAVRDAVEHILKREGLFEDILKAYEGEAYERGQ